VFKITRFTFYTWAASKANAHPRWQPM